MITLRANIIAREHRFESYTAQYAFGIKESLEERVLDVFEAEGSNSSPPIIKIPLRMHAEGGFRYR